MKNLLEFLIKNITGSDDFSVEEEVQEGFIVLNVTANKDLMGLIIGKEGKTVKNLRKILSVMGVLQKSSVKINVAEK